MSYFKGGLVMFAAIVIGVGTYGYNACSFEPITARIVDEEKASALEILTGELRRLHRWMAVRGWLNDSGNGHVFENQLVRDLYQNPYVHFPFLKEQLGARELERDHKVLWIKLSQCLEPDDYVSLIDVVLQSDLDGSEKALLVDTILSPSPYWGTSFNENYSVRPYREALEKVLAHAEVAGSSERTIEYIRSGTGKSFVEAHREAGGRFPRIPCNH